MPPPESSGLSSRVETEPGVAGDMQRLLLKYPQCPEQANPFVHFVYANAEVLLAAIRMAEE